MGPGKQRPPLPAPLDPQRATAQQQFWLLLRQEDDRRAEQVLCPRAQLRPDRKREEGPVGSPSRAPTLHGPCLRASGSSIHEAREGVVGQWSQDKGQKKHWDFAGPTSSSMVALSPLSSPLMSSGPMTTSTSRMATCCLASSTRCTWPRVSACLWGPRASAGRRGGGWHSTPQHLPRP